MNQKEEATQKPDQTKNYSPPEWSALPREYFYLELWLSSSIIEVIKGGQIAEKIVLGTKPFFIFGRQPDADVIVEHPSLSRHHCVIQFGKESEQPFLCDLGSTHGTYLNTQKAMAFEYMALKHGDVFQLGFSSRMYVYNHTTDVEQLSSVPLPDTKTVTRKRKKGRRCSVNWGIEEDAAPEPETEEIEWKEYAETHGLTQKQQKIADKIRKLERRKEKLEADCKRIHEKEEKFEELTLGQITALLNNENALERISRELEESEEAIQTSILEKINPSTAKERLERREQESDGDDEFYDRSRKNRKKHEEKAMPVVTIQSLIQERGVLENRQVFLKTEIDASVDDNSGDGDDALDAFMSNLNTDTRHREKLEHSREYAANVTRLNEIEKLMKWIDPDGFYKGS